MVPSTVHSLQRRTLGACGTCLPRFHSRMARCARILHHRVCQPAATAARSFAKGSCEFESMHRWAASVAVAGVGPGGRQGTARTSWRRRALQHAAMQLLRRGVRGAQSPDNSACCPCSRRLNSLPGCCSASLAVCGGRCEEGVAFIPLIRVACWRRHCGPHCKWGADTPNFKCWRHLAMGECIGRWRV
jgi:hypothetical protein